MNINDISLMRILSCERKKETTAEKEKAINNFKNRSYSKQNLQLNIQRLHAVDLERHFADIQVIKVFFLFWGGGHICPFWSH